MVLVNLADQVLLLNHVLPLFDRSGMLSEEIFFHILSFSLFPHSLGSFDNLLPKALIILLSSFFNHGLKVSVVLLVLLEVFYHFWLRGHGGCVNTCVTLVKLLLVL